MSIVSSNLLIMMDSYGEDSQNMGLQTPSTILNWVQFSYDCKVIATGEHGFEFVGELSKADDDYDSDGVIYNIYI